ncbi:hypothetical protein IEQ34_014215 [Dendrobium chrysotoxum]|uniref:Transmembrane protein n=1 Tax=Dendrobium chrysotoxum TaxID=161865 RepID=A0AAV7GL19_DENCH|nr:hypothetical protein IEQ34_014215 [Dendrobium chrysotoxum]
MEEFPSFYDKCKCLGHSIDYCHPIHVSVPMSGNAVISNPINANVQSELNAPGVVEIMDNVTSTLLVLPIKALVDNENKGSHLVNEVNVDSDNVGLIDGGDDPSTPALPLILSCNIGRILWVLTLSISLPMAACPADSLVSNSPVMNEGLDDEDLSINDNVVEDDGLNVNLMASAPLIDIPISLNANDDSRAQLVANSKMSVVVQGDWLHECDSASNWDGGDEANVPLMYSRETDDLKVIQIAEDGFLKKVGKRKQRKSKKNKTWVFFSSLLVSIWLGLLVVLSGALRFVWLLILVGSCFSSLGFVGRLCSDVGWLPSRCFCGELWLFYGDLRHLFQDGFISLLSCRYSFIIFYYRCGFCVHRCC